MSQTTIDNLHNILNDIIIYLCHIHIEYNCIAAPNPGSLHEILNTISDYLCKIPLCDNCIIPDDEKDLHTIINEILTYICVIDVGENCIGAPRPTNLHDIIKRLSDYVCIIQIDGNCIPGINSPDNLHNILTNIIKYLCEIPITCDILGLNNTNKTLYEAIEIILDLYCNPRKIPLIHYCIDFEGVNNHMTLNFNINDIINAAENRYGRQFNQTQRNNMLIACFSELRSFLTTSRGPIWKSSPTSRDVRLFISLFPGNYFWNHADFEFKPDTGDYAFTRYPCLITKNSTTVTVVIGPIGSASCDIWDGPSDPDIASWMSQHNGDIKRTYSQRTRVSYRLHFLVGDQYTFTSVNCNLLNITANIPIPISGNPSSTQGPTQGPSSNTLYRLVSC